MAALFAARQLRHRSASILRGVFGPVNEAGAVCGAATAAAAALKAPSPLWRSQMTSTVHSWSAPNGRFGNWREAFPSVRCLLLSALFFFLCCLFLVYDFWCRLIVSQLLLSILSQVPVRVYNWIIFQSIHWVKLFGFLSRWKCSAHACFSSCTFRLLQIHILTITDARRLKNGMLDHLRFRNCRMMWIILVNIELPNEISNC